MSHISKHRGIASLTHCVWKLRPLKLRRSLAKLEVKLTPDKFLQIPLRARNTLLFQGFGDHVKPDALLGKS